MRRCSGAGDEAAVAHSGASPSDVLLGDAVTQHQAQVLARARRQGVSTLASM